MRTSLIFTGIAIALVCITQGCKDDDLSDIDCSSVAATYNADIKPLVLSNCATSGCHGAGSSNGDYTTYAGLKAAADNGRIDDKVIKDKSMPPSGPLSLDDRKKIKCWLNNGAPNN